MLLDWEQQLLPLTPRRLHPLPPPLAVCCWRCLRREMAQGLHYPAGLSPARYCHLSPGRCGGGIMAAPAITPWPATAWLLTWTRVHSPIYSHSCGNMAAIMEVDEHMNKSFSQVCVVLEAGCVPCLRVARAAALLAPAR